MAWKNSGIMLVVMAVVVCAGEVTAEGQGRAFSSFFSSKLDDLYKLRQSLLDAAVTTTTTTTTTPATTTTTTTTTTTATTTYPSTFGWSSRGEGNSAFQGLLSLTEDVDDLQLDPSPESRADDGEAEGWNDNNILQSVIWALHNSLQIPEVGDEEPEDQWVRVKGIYENMRSILQEMYQTEDDDPTPGLLLLDRLISFGDYMHFLRDVVSSFESDLLEYLSAKWSDVKASLIHAHPLLRVVLSSSAKELGWSILAVVLRQFGSVLHRQAFTHIREIEFVIELMRSSGFKEEEVREVFGLLGLPTTALDGDVAESRQLAGYGAYTLDKSGGYGHSGGYGGGGGYGQMGGGYGHVQSFDPFVLLAGLAFATFLAYLIYRLLSTTATTAGGRDMPEMASTLDLSDVPVFMGNLYSWLEGTKGRYEDEAKSLQDEGRNLSWAANHLWESYKVDRLSRGCVRRFLCDYVTSARDPATSTAASVENLALTSLAQLFGEEKTAAFLDHLSSDLVEGRNVRCEVLAPKCDDEAYRMTSRPLDAADGLQNTTKKALVEE